MFLHFATYFQKRKKKVKTQINALEEELESLTLLLTATHQGGCIGAVSSMSRNHVCFAHVGLNIVAHAVFVNVFLLIMFLLFATYFQKRKKK